MKISTVLHASLMLFFVQESVVIKVWLFLCLNLYVYDNAPDTIYHVYESFDEVAMLMILDLASGLAAHWVKDFSLSWWRCQEANQRAAAHQIKSVWELFNLQTPDLQIELGWISQKLAKNIFICSHYWLAVSDEKRISSLAKQAILQWQPLFRWIAISDPWMHSVPSELTPGLAFLPSRYYSG